MLPPPPPASIVFKPFWLMRVLSKTISTGGYLTPKIYVPKAVWYEQNTIQYNIYIYSFSIPCSHRISSPLLSDL